MSKFWMLVVHLVAVLCLLAPQLPRPCAGNDAGGACTASACACVATCTCQADHLAARALYETLRQRPGCCKLDADLVRHAEALVAACHGESTREHVALASEPPLALPPRGGQPICLAVVPAPPRSGAKPPRGREPPALFRPPWLHG